MPLNSFIFSYIVSNVCYFYPVWVFPSDSVVKNPPANAGDAENSSLIPELERPLGVGNSNLLQYSCLENSMDRGT